MKFLATDMTEFFISTEMDFIQTSRIAYMHYYIILVGHSVISQETVTCISQFSGNMDLKVLFA